MIHRLYIILVLSVFISFAGNAQNINEEPSLDKIQDATSDVKKYDLVNHQVIADQKYFKNNPDALTKQITISLEEQVSLKSSDQSADDKGIKANHTPLDAAERSSSSADVPYDSKFSLSEENNSNKKSNSKNKELNSSNRVDSPSNQTQLKPHSKGNSSVNEKSIEQGNKIIGQPTNSRLYEKSHANVSKSNEVEVVIETPSNLLKEKNNVKKEKYFAAPKIVEKPKVIEYPKVNTVQVDKITEPDNNREQRVVHDLINSGNYNVYDDGKYIKFSKKK